MFFPEAHDLFKLVHKGGQSPHPCPDALREIFPQQAEAILKRNLLFLNHHCFTPRPTGHSCRTKDFYPLDSRWILLSVADSKAAAVSRWVKKKLLEGKGSKPWSSFNIIRVWRSTERESKPPDMGFEIIEELAEGRKIEDILAKHKCGMEERAEDMNRPFASLWTHSELTKWWFDFLSQNMDYFEVPDTVENEEEARRVRGRVERRAIYFIRYRILLNRHLSRMADRQIIEDVPKVHEALIRSLDRAKALYELGFEALIVVCPPAHLSPASEKGDFLMWIKELFASAKAFSTNYSLHLTSARAALVKDRLLYPFKSLFGPYSASAYPRLPEVIRPGGNDREAQNAILCELCQMAPAVRTHEKTIRLEQVQDEVTPSEETEDPMPVGARTKDQVRSHEHLCEGCYSLRENQDNTTERIGKDYARWEEDPEAHAAYVHIQLDMPQLWKRISATMKQAYVLEEQPVDGDLGFSPIKEFLSEFDSFLAGFSKEVFLLPEYSEEKNHIAIMRNLICLRVSESSQLGQIMAIYLRLIKQFFPCWIEDPPFSVTMCFGRVKYPFYEYWMVLDEEKPHPINIYKLRSAGLEVDIAAWERLLSLELENRRVSRFFHRLAALEEKTAGSRLVMDTEIIENRRLLGEAYSAFTARILSAQDILAYCKIFGKIQ